MQNWKRKRIEERIEGKEAEVQLGKERKKRGKMDARDQGFDLQINPIKL